MNRRAAFTLVLPALLLGMLAGCAPAQPMPASITLADGGREQQLKPGDAAYAAIAGQLAALVAGLDTPLYAYYPPERVAAEILIRPHLAAIYDPPATLQGKGYAAQTAQLIVVVTGEGPLVLTRPREGADWTASEASDGRRFIALFQVVRDRAGIDLQAPVK